MSIAAHMHVTAFTCSTFFFAQQPMMMAHRTGAFCWSSILIDSQEKCSNAALDFSLNIERLESAHITWISFFTTTHTFFCIATWAIELKLPLAHNEQVSLVTSSSRNALVSCIPPLSAKWKNYVLYSSPILLFGIMGKYVTLLNYSPQQQGISLSLEERAVCELLVLAGLVLLRFWVAQKPGLQLFPLRLAHRHAQRGSCYACVLLPVGCTHGFRQSLTTVHF